MGEVEGQVDSRVRARSVPSSAVEFRTNRVAWAKSELPAVAKAQRNNAGGARLTARLV
jgi:hypothetical protein